MSPIIPSRYGHPKYNVFPQKSRASSLGGFGKTAQRGTPGSDSKSRRKQRIEESKITVQPSEDDDGDNFFSKHLAAARFQRNHRLIHVLFNDVVVEQEQPCDNERLQNCKKRAKTLAEYQKKLEDEIVELNEKFAVKKAKIMDDSKAFAGKLADFIVNSKKDIETARAAAEVRRQQEAIVRQQQAKANSTMPTTVSAPSATNTSTISSSNSSETKLNLTQVISSQSNIKETQMEISFDGDTNHTNDVRQLLDRVISSVAKEV